jgi:hypothetical protein
MLACRFYQNIFAEKWISEKCVGKLRVFNAQNVPIELID